MSMMVSPYRFGSAGASTPAGALVYRTTNQSVAGNADVPFQSEVYDTANYFTVGTSAANFVIPATGLYRFQINGSCLTTNVESTKTYKNGSGVVGLHSACFPAVSSLGWGNGASGVLSLTAADTVKVQNAFSTLTYGYNNDSRLTWHSVEVLDPATQYALVYRSSTLSITTGAWRTVGFDSEIADTASIHDNVTNNSRLTITSGMTAVSSRFRLSWGIVSSNTTHSFVVNFAKNGTTTFVGGPAKGKSGNGNKIFSGMSPPLNGSLSDYFEMQIFTDVNFTIINDPYTYFCLETVPASIVSCIAKKSANQTITTSYSDITFDAADEYDDASIHDNVTNNHLFTVPSGKTRARLHFFANPSASGSGLSVLGKMNGTHITGGTPAECSAGAYGWVGFSSPWVAVTGGETFSVEAKVVSGTVTIGAGCWGALECE